MGTGAFRDGGAAVERAAALTEENEQLRKENASLRAERDGHASGSSAAVHRERDELREKLADQSAAHVAAVNRIKQEAREQRREIERRNSELELRNTQLERRVAHLEAPRPPDHADAEQLAHGNNEVAVRQRLIDERDDLAREVRELRAELQRRERAKPSLLARVLGRLR